MNRIPYNVIVRAVRVNPTIRSVAPYRWQSSQYGGQQGQGSQVVAGAAGGLAVLLGGFAWYHFSGTRQVVNTARDTLNKAEELKEKVKEKAGDSAETAANTVSYLRSATATLIPGSAPFLGKVFDQIENISKEHGDEAKRIFDDTYKDFEKLAKEGGLDSQTASKAVDILQKRVKELQDLAGEVGGDAYNKLISDNPKLKDQISEPYNKLKDLVEKAKEKKPELQNLMKDTSSELVKIFKDNGVSKETVQKAQDLLKKKAEEAKKLGEDVGKDNKGSKENKDSQENKDAKQNKDGKDNKDSKENKDAKQSKDGKDNKDSKENKDAKQSKDAKQNK